MPTVYQIVPLLKKIWKAQSTRIVLSFVVLVVLVIVLWKVWDSFLQSFTPQFVTWFFGFIFLFLLVLIVWHFTKPLPGIEEESADKSGFVDPWLKPENARIKRYWMTLSYWFMILALAAAVVPFTKDLRKDPGERNWEVEH